MQYLLTVNVYRHDTILYNCNNTHRVYIHTYILYVQGGMVHVCSYNTHTCAFRYIGDRGPTHLQDGYLMLQGILMFVWKT